MPDQSQQFKLRSKLICEDASVSLQSNYLSPAFRPTSYQLPFFPNRGKSCLPMSSMAEEFPVLNFNGGSHA
jgi:hypothetical protein